jgi:hypothetical protein
MFTVQETEAALGLHHGNETSELITLSADVRSSIQGAVQLVLIRNKINLNNRVTGQ